MTDRLDALALPAPLPLAARPRALMLLARRMQPHAPELARELCAIARHESAVTDCVEDRPAPPPASRWSRWMRALWRVMNAAGEARARQYARSYL